MPRVTGEQRLRWPEVDLGRIEREVTDWDRQAYLSIVSEVLTPIEVERVVRPPATYPRQRSVLAVHWHPEHVPLDLIGRRLDALYPGRERELIIPTQHNVLVPWGEYSGVEVDCWSRGFNRKVQLLLHFRTDRLARADAFKSMLRHTFLYRSSQLFAYLAALVEPDSEAMRRAAGEMGASEDLVEFVQIHAAKLSRLIEAHGSDTPEDAHKNKLVRNYFDALRELYDPRFIQRAQALLKLVKEEVKRGFALSYFFRTSEVIEEVRSLGGCIVVPHPEQFWPILLADYDVDGYEVWNPQSREYTDFLINAVARQNAAQRRHSRPLLVLMGDDTHMSEKLKDPGLQDAAKSSREIGLQPAWEDLSIRKSLIVAGISRRSVIDEYRARLG